MHSLGYEFVPARSTKGGALENYLRAIDSRRGITAVAILTPTYLEFTPFALRLVPDLASLADGQRRESGMKFSHVTSVMPALAAARLYMEQGS